MRILVTNDDGILSPGLWALADAASRLGEVFVAAPETEQSATGHAITIAHPVRAFPHSAPLPWPDFPAYRVRGTPADCVALGLHLFGPLDLVLSGVNLGSNLGHEIWHSGTVAAAKQGRLFGLSAAAFSVPMEGENPDFGALKPWLVRTLEALLRLERPFLVNVNLPLRPKGFLWTRQSVRAYEGVVVPGKDPMGRPLYWFAAKPLKEAEEGTDRWAVAQGFISATPLRLDLTDETRLQPGLAHD
ncbi:5'-nucleotidase [Thermus sp. 2.9]|uniref:5'/3'-nucleotidase SurE n=1 Tax=Thermus sp. (strain 2.9) TaxID=1577051 RepID=UPI000542B01E|nr:5'/3'-nucleotidase SurE [Thermus sp. 2.9]KHG64460.1 5'-nucleotidase [Thermus sp. 2.9]